MQLVGERQAAERRQGQERGGQAELELPPPPLLGRPRHGHGPLPLGRLHPLLHACQVGRDPLGHGVGVARPALGLDRQAVPRQSDQLGLGPAAVQAPQGVGRVAVGRLAEDLRRGPARERRRPREDLAEDRAQGEDVGPLVDPVGLAPRLLGGHVARRAHDRAGAGQVPVRAAPRRGDQGLLGRLLARPGIGCDPAPRQDPRQAPVHHLDLAEAADHHVGGLQVAMDHPAGVGVGHRLRDGREGRQEPGQVVGRPGAGREQVGQRLPFHQLHAEEGPAVGEGAQLVDRHHARVLELAADLRLLDEAADQVGLVTEVGPQDLDGDVAAQVGVAALEDGAHAAAGDLAVDTVADRRVGVGGIGTDDRPRGLAGRRVAQQHAGDGADALGDGVEDAGAGRPEGAGRLARRGRRAGERGPHQAIRAEPARGVGGQRRAAIRTLAFLAHGEVLPGFPTNARRRPLHMRTGNRPQGHTNPRGFIARGPRTGPGPRLRRRPGRPRCGRSPRGGSRRTVFSGARRPS